MKPKETHVINVNFDLRLLAGLALVAAIVFFAYSAVTAQDGSPPSPNDVTEQEAEAEADLPEAAVVECTDNLLPSANGECIAVENLGSPQAAADEVDAVTAIGSGSRRFYLTNSNYAADKVLSACASGFHTASLYEILDVSNLTYDYKRAAAHTKDDSGWGPPSFWYGWIRTGWSSNATNTAGTGNCKAWTSTVAADDGSIVRLSRLWESAPGEIFTWDASPWFCAGIAPVWCVEN